MEQLVKLAMNGQKEAFEQLVTTEKPKLLAKAYSYVSNREDAADIVQETLLKAYQSIHQLKEPKYFSTWLFKILIRESFSALKKKKRTLTVELELQQHYWMEHEVTPLYEFVHEALSSIRNEYKTVLVLFYFYDFKIQDIAYMQNKPINTVKMHLHRGRIQLKKLLEQRIQLPIKQKEVVHMLKEQLANIALNFVSIPADFQLLVEDYSNEQATFMWSKDDLNNGIDVSLDQNGKLLELTRPPATTGVLMTTEQQQSIAEQFLLEQYTEALDYLTLSTVIEKEDATRFLYEQYVGGYPLASHYTKIVISKYGEIIDFKYGGYTKTPPTFPNQLTNKQTILQQMQNAKWSLTLRYLSTECYSVPVSGLYPIYESPIMYQSFNALNGKSNYEEEIEEQDSIIPFPQVAALEKLATPEEIVGITDSMEKLREIPLDDDVVAIVWRNKDWQAPEGKTMENFLLEHNEDTVKVTIHQPTNTLKEFVWFKERTGELSLSFEACRDIACAFITTYFAQYVPFLQIKMTAPEFNEVHRAFFSFPLHDKHGQIIDGEEFYVAVNRTTGLIDLLWAPKITLSIVEAYEPSRIQPFERVKSALNDVETFLTWSKQYDEEETKEILKYELGQVQTKQRVLGIDAITGKLIVSMI